MSSNLKRLRSLARSFYSNDEGVAVLVIAAVLIVIAGTTVTVGVMQRQARELDLARAGRADLTLIQDAIEVWAIANDTGGVHLLPCPADPDDGANFGQAQSPTGVTCANPRGIVPFVTLGLSESEARDAQGNFVTYIVDNGDIRVCNNGTHRTGTLDDLNSASSYLYALISHGQNEYGAVNASTQSQLTSPSSTREQANCVVGSSSNNCGVTNQDEFRSGPASTEDADFFDDIVRAVQGDSTFTVECPVIDEDPNSPEGAQIAFSNAETQRNFTGGANEELQGMNAFSRADYDADGDGEDETEVLRVDSNDAFDTRTCSYTEPTFPLQGYTIRQYAEVFFESTDATTKGGGLVIGYFAHKTTGGDATDITRPDPDGGGSGNPLNAQPPCGGRNQYLGFGDEEEALSTAASDAGDYTELAQPNDVFRFGLEIDTQTGFEDSGVAEQIFDPDNNHISIVIGNNNHAGTETDATAPPDMGAVSDANLNGPVCRDDLATVTGGPFDSFGVAPGDRSPAYNVTVALDGSDEVLDAQQACYYPAADVTWLEDGDPIDGGSGFADAYQQVRTELHWHAGNGCADPATEVRFDAWVWNQGDSVSPDSCGADPVDCDNLNSDYYDPDRGDDTDRAPHISSCIALDEFNMGDTSFMEAFRLGFTSGLPAAPTGADRGGEVTIQRFGLNFARVDGISTKTYAGDTAASDEITEGEIRDALYNTVPTGNLAVDQAYARIPGNVGPDVRVFMERGKFYLDETDFIGNTGVSDNNLIANIDPGSSPFEDETGFYNADEREKLTVEFDALYRKFTVNLRDFGASDNGSYAGSLNEQIILRAYNTTLAEDEQLVATETYRTCDLNGLSAGTTSSMVISTDFGLSGTDYFDKVQIIPEPIDSSDLEGDTRFAVGAVKACGADHGCAFDRTLVSDNNNNDTEFRCVEFTPIAAASVGSGDSGEINPDTINPELGLADNANEDTDRAWLDFNNYPDGGETFNLTITATGEIRSRDNNNDEVVGFGVGNSYGVNNNFMDTIDNPTGAEAETEELVFHFDQRWNRLRIGFSQFGQEANGGLDRAQVTLCDGGPDGDCEDYTITACPGAGTQNNWRGDAFITTGLASTLFDTVIVSPLINDEPTGNRYTDFYVRSLKACDDIGACTDLAFGNDDGDGRWCDLTP